MAVEPKAGVDHRGKQGSSPDPWPGVRRGSAPIGAAARRGLFARASEEFFSKAVEAGGWRLVAFGCSGRRPAYPCRWRQPPVSAPKNHPGRRPTHSSAVANHPTHVPPSGLKRLMIPSAPGPDDPGSSYVGLRPEEVGGSPVLASGLKKVRQFLCRPPAFEGCWLFRPEAGISLPVASATGIGAKNHPGRRPTHSSAVANHPTHVPPSGLKSLMIPSAPGPDDPGNSYVGLRPEEGATVLVSASGLKKLRQFLCRPQG